MLGSRFVQYLKPVPPRYLSRLSLFIDFLRYKSQDGITRASYLTPNGNGARLFFEILRSVNMSTVVDNPAAYTSDGSYLLQFVRGMEKFIDARTGKHTTTSLFIRSRTNCFELIIPTRRESPSIEIPFGKDYSDPAWDVIRPFRIVDMGAADLRFAIQTDYLVYPNHGPTHAIYTLDCLALLGKFLAYYKVNPKTKDIEQIIFDFVHKEVIVETLINDTVALWLRNIYKQQLVLASPLESLTSTMWDSVNIDTIGSDFTGAMYDVQHLKQDLRNQSITGQTALSSLLLSADKKSFSAYYTELFKTTKLPREHPYIWIECVKNIAWWEFILLVTSLTPDLPDAKSLQRDVLRDVRICAMNKPWSEIHGSIPLKTMIQSRINGLYSYLQNQP